MRVRLSYGCWVEVTQDDLNKPLACVKWTDDDFCLLLTRILTEEQGRGDGFVVRSVERLKREAMSELQRQ